MDDFVLCELAVLAYEDWDKVKEITGLMHLTGFHYWEHGDTQVYIVHSETETVLAFRGTQPNRLKDLFTDIRFFKDLGPYGFGKVHRGFRNALSYVWGDVVAYLMHLGPDKVKDLNLVGHSMGGALAELAGAFILSSTFMTNPTKIVTFGAPRVGNKEYAERYASYKGEHHRYVNCSDWVPHQPPRWMFYKHATSMIYLDRAGRRVPDVTCWLRWKDAIALRCRNLFIARSRCHLGRSYVTKMKEGLDREVRP